MIMRNGYPAVLAAVLFLFVLLALPPTLHAAPRHHRIDLPLRSLEPAPDGAAYLQQRATGDAEQLLLQFEDHPDAAERHALRDVGLHLQYYVGGGAWVVYAEPNASTASLDRTNLRWAGSTMAEDRIAPRVTAEQLPDWAAAGDDILVSVQFVKQIDDVEGEARLMARDLIVGDYISPLNAWYIQADQATVIDLANDPAVLAIDYIAPPMGEVNAGARAAMNVDTLYDPPFELRGAGVTVCVYDGGIADITHPDFENRATEGENGGISDHATHVMGTVGGNGPSLYRGMAPEATLLTYEYEACSPNCLYDSPQDIFDNYFEANLIYGARIFTNSIGANIYANGYPCEWQGDYEITSALLDGIVRGDLGQPVIVGFAAGNERGGGPCGSTYETLTVPAGAKNIITVGASDDNDGNASFTSWGPPDDGRIKPTVMAPGVSLTSTAPGGGYQTMSGTSMATPAVAGVNALLVEAWQTYASSPFPMPPTVKALLVNGAEDLWNEGPDYRNGWGRVDAVRSVEMIQTFGYLESSVGDDGVVNHPFTVPAGIDELKVTVAWSDMPAAYLPPITLINDLDMVLISPGGAEYQPWVLDPDSPSSPATTGVNVRDVVEQVLVNAPQAGQWTLRVTGTDVPEGPQDFSAVANVPLAEGVTIVSGTVSDADSGDPLENVLVGVDGSGGGTRTDSNGNFAMYLPVNEITPISASVAGYGTKRQYVLPGQDSVILDYSLVARPVGTVEGTVLEMDGSPSVGATVSVAELPGITALTNVTGAFTMELPGLSAYTVVATAADEYGSANVFVRPTLTHQVEITVAGPVDQITSDESYGYIAVQNSDAHPFATPFNWVEIDPGEGGPGTLLPTDEEEGTFLVDLGFTFYYFGHPYTEITVNENGFFSFGNTQRLGNDIAADYSNSSIPDEDGPPNLVGPFWEDFRANDTHLSYWSDAANGRFVLEWHNSRQWPTDGARETFQVILYDARYNFNPEFYLPGIVDGRILFQYSWLNDLSNATVGIENASEEDGIEILAFETDGSGSYAETASVIDDSSTVLFYRPMAIVAGQVSLFPVNPDLPITVEGPLGVTEVDDDGRYIMAVPPGACEIFLSAPGYERRKLGVTATDWSATSLLNVTLTKLQPPGNVHYAVDGTDVTISWTPLGGNVADFLGAYRVYKNGLLAAQTQQTSWVDSDPTPPPLYWVTALYAGGESDSSDHATPGVATTVGEGLSLLPDEFEIGEAYPNPFNPSTSVRIALPDAAPVRVAVYDILGRHVTELMNGQKMAAGYHTLHWTADGQASGVYFLHVEAGPLQAVRKIALVK